MRYVHEENVKTMPALDWVRTISVPGPRSVYDEDGDPDAGASAFVDLVTHLFVERPGMSPVFGLAAEVFDGGGPTITYKVWYHGLVEAKGPPGVGRDGVYEVLHPEEILVDLPTWLAS